MLDEQIYALVGDYAFGIWFLIGAALVFFMQCGFAMVETGSPAPKTQATLL